MAWRNETQRKQRARKRATAVLVRLAEGMRRGALHDAFRCCPVLLRVLCYAVLCCAVP